MSQPPMRVLGFQPVLPTVFPPPQPSDAFRRALDEHNDRDWLSGMLEESQRRHEVDDLREARGVLMPLVIFLSVGLGITLAVLAGFALHLHR